MINVFIRDLLDVKKLYVEVKNVVTTLLCMLQHLEHSQSSHSIHFMDAGARVSQPSHFRGPGP